jgi:hypothetical protein
MWQGVRGRVDDHAGSENALRLSLLRGKGTTKARAAVTHANVLLIWVASSLISFVSHCISQSYGIRDLFALSL